MNVFNYKNIVYVLLLAFIMLNVACESNPARYEEAFAKNAQWSEQDKRLISEGMINYDMTKDQVKAAWGKPCGDCPGTRKYDTGTESWEYQTQVVFFNEQGKVTRWVKR